MLNLLQHIYEVLGDAYIIIIGQSVLCLSPKPLLWEQLLK